MKALGTGLTGGITWHDVAVGREKSGKPVLIFSGAAKARADAMGVVHAHVTITHTSELAMAVVILEGL